MDIVSSPKSLTTKRRVNYRKSTWTIHEFEVWSGELVCRAVALRMMDSLLVWIGGREAQLNEVALGVPLAGMGNGALATALLGEEGTATGLARRLTLSLGRQVHVCCGQVFDRFTAPLVEKGIVSEIKNLL